jgi:hypothetical protein
VLHSDGCSSPGQKPRPRGSGALGFNCMGSMQLHHARHRAFSRDEMLFLRHPEV